MNYPVINPIAFQWGQFAIGWYSLAYFAALLSVWVSARYFVKHHRFWNGLSRPDLGSLDFLIMYVFLGSLLGGRIGYVLVKFDQFWPRSQDITVIWQGGNSLHGAGIGGCIAVLVFAIRNKYSSIMLADICAPGVAIGIFFGRIANFIRMEHLGTPSDVAWAIVVPGAGGHPRHPSQLYEAGLEGLAVFAILIIAAHMGALKYTGVLAGIFGICHGLARVFCENFREPDPTVFNYSSHITMGMMLSVPMIVAGIIVIWYAWRRALISNNDAYS